ncbi:type 2 lanthipeptide synthetase LanM family protein [Streptomyces sp. NPDC058391]|uniref:type 2 lanthipeptide synthetase LanM family protein n=1 Tax=Streptomyces sp. NPDC058391 TaxID=3346476 RepID=UPI0036617115
MTSSAPSAASAPGLPNSWWATGLTLRERLAAPHAPLAAASAAAHGRRALPELEQACWTARLGALGVLPEQAAALAAESAELLGERAAEPDWARFVEEAVAAAPELSGNDGAGHSRDGKPDSPRAEGSDVFVPVFRPLVDAAVRAMTEKCGPSAAADAATLSGQFADRLGQQLARQAARTLVAELAAARAAAGLTGAGPEDRFADFLRRTGSRRGLARLFARYPVLARLLAQTCEQAADAVAELLTRFTADRAGIVAALLGDADPGPLVALDLGLGDTHQRGRSVALLRFADGSTVVYKPRALSQHDLLDRMVEWLNTKVPGLELRTAPTVHGDGYGWLGHIDHLSCASVVGIDRFYRRQGALLALMYAVEGTDLHYDNLVAHGDQPILIDVETLLHAELAEPTTAGPDPASAALSSSVHRTCLLPQLMVGELGAVDISAVGGAAGGSGPNARIAWEGAGTDTMRLVRRPAPFGGGRNRPLLAGKDIGPGPADYVAALLNGFRAGYDAITSDRDELCGPAGLLADGAREAGRLIVRPTQLYARLLEESLHPGVLRDALDRDALLSVLWAESSADPVRQRLIEDEIADLWCGDVPVFFHRPAGPDLWTSRGARISGVLDTPGLASAVGKIEAMGEVDRHDQEWIISATLATARPWAGSPHGPAAVPARTTPAAVPEPSVLLAAACGIADEIVARAAHGPVPGGPLPGHRGRANWIGLELIDDAHWAVLPMGAGLGQGYCGVALFLAQLGRLTGSSRYTDLAREALTPLPALVGALAADPGLSRAVGPGAFHGLGGICYAVARLATLLGDGTGDCLPTALAALAHTVDEAPDAALSFDVSAGLAGALAALLSVRRERGIPEADGLANRIADILLARADDGRTGAGARGFAFGDAGVGWSLLRYAADGGGKAHGDAGREMVSSALAATEQNNQDDLSWCSGLSGTVLAAADPLGRLSAGTRGAGPDGPDVDRAVRVLGAHTPLTDHSLCHGDLGTIEALSVLAAQGHQEARTGLARRAALTVGALRHGGHRCGTPGQVHSPGLLTGLSGIGYALLRLGFAEQVPSVLLLDPTPT